jgi:hypothetical protein
MHSFKLHVGQKELFEEDAPTDQFSAFFEDDGEAGYFYALDLRRKLDGEVVDALHIYNVENVIDSDRCCELSIAWSEDGSKCALLINGYPHAAFDFGAKRGCCRNNFPNLPESDGWW